MRCSRGPGWRGRGGSCGSDRHVLRRRKALRRTVAREVPAVVVGRILLFIRREVTKVRLHRCDIRLVLRVRKLRNRDRGKNADDDDNDQKLNKCKTLFVAHFGSPEMLGASVFATSKTMRLLVTQHVVMHGRCQSVVDANLLWDNHLPVWAEARWWLVSLPFAKFSRPASAKQKR